MLILVPHIALAAACLGDGTTCGTAAQVISKSIRSVEIAQIDSSLYLFTADGLGASTGNRPGYIYVWQPSQRCFGNGTTCGTAVQAISSSGSMPEMQPFSVNGQMYLLTIGGFSPARLFRWQPANRCFGNGTICGSTLQSGIAANADMDAFVSPTDGKTYLTSGDTVTVFQPAQQCLGNGTTCGAALQSITAGSYVDGIALSMIGEDIYMSRGLLFAAGSGVYKWQGSDQCFGNGTTCGTAVQTVGATYSYDVEPFTISGDHYTYWAARNVAQLKWMSAAGCFGNGTTCGATMQPASINLDAARVFAIGTDTYLTQGGSNYAFLMKWRPGQSCFGDENSCGNSLQDIPLNTYDIDTFVSAGKTYVVFGNSDQASVFVVITPPAAPTITATSSALVGASVMVSTVAVDPDGDTIRYAFDWDNNSTVDEYSPATGYTASGAQVSVSHSWATAGAKTYKVRTEDSGGAASAWSSKTITIAPPPPTVLLTASSGTYVQSGTPVSLTWSSSNASSCTGTNLTTGGATGGTRQVTPTRNTTYTVSCTGSGGTASDSKTVQYVCMPTNICSGANIINSCTGATVQSCSYLCSAGACVAAPPPGFSSFTATGPQGAFTSSGHLTVRPTLVRPGEITRVYWNLSNVVSCAVTGTSGNAWAGASSGAAGKTTLPITQQTTYTLACTGLDGSDVTEYATVNVAPAWREI